MYIENSIRLACFYKPIAEDPHERRHAEIYKNLKDLPYPFNFEIPEKAPDFGKNDISASCVLKHSDIKTLYFISNYNYRYNGNIKINPTLGNYDRLDIEFGYKKKEIDYEKVVYELFPMVIKGYGGYRAKLLLRDICFYYQEQYKDIVDKLVHSKEKNFDGTNNIFALCPAQHWSNELCQKALGYGAGEAISRLRKAEALMVKPLLDGVYCVLNDDRNLDLAGYTEMNNRFKKALGINDGTVPRAKLFGII